MSKLLTFITACFLSSLVQADAITNEQYVYRLTQKGAMTCISQVVEKEAGNEGEKGRELVAISILNRAIKEKKHICTIVAKKGQFSSYSEASKRFGMLSPRRRSEETVLDVLVRSIHNKQSAYQGVTSFHNRSVNPNWAGYKLVVVHKNHSFYTKG